ncbi:MAG TPA: glycerol-3-phosphate 1-O-acyltransferase PlsY [Balneolaceae bacterium]|nr:glycerol-3-phosphate 1-O-acyltransferase PlsY [Balneolaceae bacterium]
MVALLVVILISYLLGSIPSSLWIGKLFKGIDIREHGSGNAGATNTFRILGWKPGIVVLAIDFMKGFAAAWWISKLAYIIGSGPVAIIPSWDINPFLMIICGITAVIGHMFPLYANFDGGKGMAAASGMLVAIEPLSVAITFAVFLAVMFISRYVSLASLVAAFIYPITLIIERFIFGMQVDGSVLILAALIGLFIIYMHRENIKRLAAGTENRIGSFKPAKGWLNKEKSQAAS